MTISTRNRIIFVTADGTEYLSKAEAESHEFRLAINLFCERHLYSGMLPHEVASILIEQKAELAKILEI